MGDKTKWIFKKSDAMVWSGYIWLRMEIRTV
jgi:hypothetical protein